MLIHPQARRGDQRQARDIVGCDGRHLARDHSTHREAGQNWIFQAKPLHYIPGVECEIQHVSQFFALFAVAIARHQRREHMELLRQCVQKAEIHIESAGAVQEYQRFAFAAFVIAYRNALGLNCF